MLDACCEEAGYTGLEFNTPRFWLPCLLLSGLDSWEIPPRTPWVGILFGIWCAGCLKYDSYNFGWILHFK